MTSAIIFWGFLAIWVCCLLWFSLINPRRRAKRNARSRLYNEWIDDIAQDPRFELRSLLEHVHHHTDEGIVEGVSTEWLASMANLIEIIRRKRSLNDPSLQHKLQRLYLHWRSDPDNTTPPPVMKSLEHVVRLVQTPPPEPRREEPEPDMSDSRWHGS